MRKKIKNKIHSIFALAFILISLFSACTNNSDSTGQTSASEESTKEEISQTAEAAPESKFIEVPAEWEISSSSSLIPSDYSFSYSAQSAYDGNAYTSWIPGPSTKSEKTTEAGRKIRYGINQYLEFNLTNDTESKASINSISMVNGAWMPVGERNVYEKNNRAKKIRITFDDNYYEEHTLEDGVKDFQTIEFSHPVEASKIRITFLSVYEGLSEFGENDLMIGEVEIDATVLVDESQYISQVSHSDYEYDFSVSEDNIGIKKFDVYGYSADNSIQYRYEVTITGCMDYNYSELNAKYPEITTISVKSFDPKTSAELWSEQTSSEYYGTELGDMGDMSYIDVAQNGNLIMAINIADIIVYDSATGVRLLEDSATNADKLDGKYVFSMYYGGSISCMDQNGDILWRYYIDEDYQWPSFQIENGIILASLYSCSSEEDKIVKLDIYGNVISTP